ncbi:hypothetical protein ACJX0J_028729, partial [Zea mays]
GKTVDKGTPGESNDNKPNLGKRKRFMTDEDVAVFNGMKQAVSDVAAAVRESIHAEAAPGIYNAVINCPGFSREALMYALNHMMEHKATSLVFLDMTPDDRHLYCLRTDLVHLLYSIYPRCYLRTMITDLPTHHLCCFAVFGANINNYFRFTLDLCSYAAVL